MKRIKQWFKDLVLEYVIIEVKPTPVNFDHELIATGIIRSILPKLNDAMVPHVESIYHAIASIPAPVVDVPAPVVNVPEPVAVVDVDALAGKLSFRIEQVATEMIAAALKPAPRTLEETTLIDPAPNPSAEAALLSNMPTDIQYAVRYSCRKVQNDNPSPAQGTTLGNNWHRNEACEWAKTWLRERGLRAKDTDVNLACELYYRVYIMPGKVKR